MTVDSSCPSFMFHDCAISATIMPIYMSCNTSLASRKFVRLDFCKSGIQPIVVLIFSCIFLVLYYPHWSQVFCFHTVIPSIILSSFPFRQDPVTSIFVISGVTCKIWLFFFCWIWYVIVMTFSNNISLVNMSLSDNATILCRKRSSLRVTSVTVFFLCIWGFHYLILSQ